MIQSKNSQDNIRNIFLTYALTYANGPVHLGHLLGFTQTDIWARFQKFKGHNCHFISGVDTHGTPIMINAEKQGLTPEEMVAQTSKTQLKDLNDFSIEFDHFESTHSQANQNLVYQIYNQLNQNGAIIKKTIKQAFDPEKKLFLPDRYLKGECPCCGAADQYGDGCEICGSTYETSALKNPMSTLSGQTPIYKDSEHYFFHLDQFRDPLEKWITKENHLQTEVSNKLKEWFKEGLHDWDISRDAPYFGFLIPGTTDKYFYVWLDAPVGYLAGLQTFLNQNDFNNFNHFIDPENSNTEMHHFIGKDIIYFHALFWPAMLMGANFKTPTQVAAHGYLTINGQKMSKSRGTFIKAREYLDLNLSPDYLRYYYATKLSSKIDDIDLNLEDFVQRVNSDLIGKWVNIASRSAGFITKKFEGKLADRLLDPDLFKIFTNQSHLISDLYEKREFGKCMREIMSLADNANQFIEKYQPWSLAKSEDPKDLEMVHLVTTQGLNLFKILMGYLKPVLPNTVQKAEQFFNIDLSHWDQVIEPLLDHSINKFKPLMMRLDLEVISKLSEN